jgi:putative ABC transport system permease protein
VVAAVRGVDPQVPVTDPVVMRQVVSTTFASYTLTAVLFFAFASLALALGLVGVYGVTSYTVVQRRREIGIRMALGARSRGVQRATVLRGMGPVAIGLLLGWGAAAIAGRWLSSLLFEISPADPLTFLVVPLLVLLTAAAALWIPARRAASIDPQVVLREG